jgi:hypothetical protein
MAVNIEGKVEMIVLASSSPGESTAPQKQTAIPRSGDAPILWKVVAKNHSIS